MLKQAKQKCVADLQAIVPKAYSVVVFDYRGLSVADLNELRALARQLGVHVQVGRNTLLKLAVAGTQFECLSEVLAGPSMIACSLEEPSAAAKLLESFMKDKQEVAVKGLSLGDTLLAPDALGMLAKLPTREEALAMLARCLLAPVTALAMANKDVAARFVRVMSQVAATKQ